MARGFVEDQDGEWVPFDDDLTNHADDLTLRHTALPDVGSDDWSVHHKGEIIGRIYKAPNRAHDPWFWGLTVFPSSAANSGFAPDVEAAKTAFRRRWEQVRDSRS